METGALMDRLGMVHGKPALPTPGAAPGALAPRHGDNFFVGEPRRTSGAPVRRRPLPRAASL